MDQAHLAILFDSLRSITHQMDIHSRQLHKLLGVTAPQLSILLALAEESPLPVSRLSRKIHLSAATISVTTAKLAENGLIARQRSNGDRRQVLLELTDKGRGVLNSGSSPLPDNLIRNFNNGLPDWEKNMILCALQKLTVLMQANGNKLA